MKNDRSVAGALAGAIGAIAQQVFSLLVKHAGVSNKDFGNFSGIMVMSKIFPGILSHIVQFLGHLAVGMLFGIIFAQIFKYTSSTYWWLKGMIYGFLLWILLTGVGTLFKMPVWRVINPSTAITLLLGSIIYSLVTAYTLRKLDKRTDLI